MMRLNRLFVFLLLTLAATTPVKADDYITVDPGELKSTPQDFWARGIVFSDTVEILNSGEAVKLGDKRYAPIQTRLVGTCYLDPDMEGGSTSLQVGQEYAFSGSVYQKDGGFFSSKRQFYVVIKRATLSAKGAGTLTPAEFSALASTALTNIYTAPLRDLDSIVAQALRDLQAYCSASNIEMTAIFDPQSRHAPRLNQAVRQAIYNQENKSRVPAVEFLVSLVASFMANQQGLAAPAPTPEPAAPVETTAVPPMEETPAIEPEPTELEPAPVANDVIPEEIAAPVAPKPEPVIEVAAPEPTEPIKPEPAAVSEPEPVPEPVPEIAPEIFSEMVSEPAPEPAPEVVPEVAPEAVMESAPEATPSDSVPASLLELIDEPAVVEPEPAPAVEPVVPEVPAQQESVALEEVAIPAPEPEPAPVVEAIAPSVEVMLEPTPEPVVEEVIAPRRGSTLPAAKLKLPTTPEPEKPKKAKSKKVKKEAAPEPVPAQPARKPSLLDADPNAPVPLR